MLSLFPGLGSQDVHWFSSLGLPCVKLARSSLTRQSCHPHPYPHEPMQLRQLNFKDILCGASWTTIGDVGVFDDFNEHEGQRVGSCGACRLFEACKKPFPNLNESEYYVLDLSSSPSRLVAPLVLSFSHENPVPYWSLHKRTFWCASLTLDIRNVVHGMLQLRRFHFLCGASMSLTVFNPVLLGCSDERWILLVELDCFGDFFLFCSVSLGLVRAWVVSDWLDG
jgi:hypothetical protein